MHAAPPVRVSLGRSAGWIAFVSLCAGVAGANGAAWLLSWADASVGAAAVLGLLAAALAALRLIALGEKVVPSNFVDTVSECGIERTMCSDFDHEIEEAKLSPRELDVLCCLMAGYANKVIARKLDVCEATVKVHVKAILRKLNVHNRTQAALWANTHGINETAIAA